MINAIFLVISTAILAIFNIAGMSGIGNFVRRTFVEIPVQIVKASVAIDATDEINPDIYFSETKLEDNVKNYLTTSLKNKVKTYKISFTYFNYKDNGQFDFETNGRAKFVQMHFICNYFLNYEIDEHLTFDARKV